MDGLEIILEAHESGYWTPDLSVQHTAIWEGSALLDFDRFIRLLNFVELASRFADDITLFRLSPHCAGIVSRFE